MAVNRTRRYGQRSDFSGFPLRPTSGRRGAYPAIATARAKRYTVLTFVSTRVPMSSLPTIRPDYAQHFVYGVLVCSFVSSIAVWIGGLLAAPISGMLASVAVGILKEAADYESNWRAARNGNGPVHEVSAGDFWSTVLGGAAAAVPQLMAHAAFLR